jgi:hypothetical protein
MAKRNGRRDWLKPCRLYRAAQRKGFSAGHRSKHVDVGLGQCRGDIRCQAKTTWAEVAALSAGLRFSLVQEVGPAFGGAGFITSSYERSSSSQPFSS